MPVNSATLTFNAMFKIILIKQIFERYKSLRAAFENQTQFWLKITLSSLFHFKHFFSN